MWIGRLQYGKCDIVPGECFVATEFQHIIWLPVVPLRTWAIVEGSIVASEGLVREFDVTWEGIPIAFSWKSFLLAWTRTALLILAILSAVYSLYLALVWIMTGNRPLRETCLAVGVLVVSLGVYALSVRFARAAPARAEYLRTLLARKYGPRPAR